MSGNQDLLSRRAAVVPRALPQVTTATAASASGAVIRDAEGRELIDFAGGIGVMNAGHGHPAVVAAIREQAGRLLHTCIHVATYEPYVELCERLAARFPHGDRTKVLLLNSGAEAVENAVKIARQATGRSAVICFTDAFHGRTLLGMSLSSKVGLKRGCGPFAPEIYRLPFPNHYRNGGDLAPDEFADLELDRLRRAFADTVAADHVAAILIEPVQGEGGIVPAPVRYLRGLREICDEHGILLICDEVQTGFCRTGRWAAYQHAGVLPDLSAWAKSMGGGLPISAVIGRADVMDAAQPGTVGGTYGGNPVSCAAALATLEVMESMDLNARAEAIGRRIRERFLALQARCAAVGDVRGLGAMMAIELVANPDTRAPASAETAEVIRASVDRGVLVIPAGTYGNVIRVLSPLVITDEELDRGLAVIEEEVLRMFVRAETPVREPVPSESAR